MHTNHIIENNSTLNYVDIETAILIAIIGLLFAIGTAIF